MSYPILHVYKDEVKSQIQEMEKWRVIGLCRTEYISPLVAVKKKDESVRVCIDARYLNSQMEKDHVMPHNPNENPSSSYWQIPIRPGSQKYTSFLYEGILYVFQRLPFGLQTSLGSFIKGLEAVLGNEVGDWSIGYVDDRLIYSESPEIH